MRNLEDCKAEVFRRSEERIKERKRTRNRVLAYCIPLCLLLVVGGICIRPLLRPVDEIGKTNAWLTGIPDRELGGMAESVQYGSATFSTVEITDKTGFTEVSRNITDAKTVEELCGFMMMYFDMPTEKESIKDGTTAGANLDTIEYELRVKYGLDEKQADYILGFRNAAGEEFFFLLYGNYLYNEENGCVVTLSDAGLSDLKWLLDSVK